MPKKQNVNYDTILDEQIRKRLVEAIETSGMTQEDIANKIYVTQPTISDYKNRGKLPSLPTFARLCQALDLDANDILGIR